MKSPSQDFRPVVLLSTQDTSPRVRSASRRIRCPNGVGAHCSHFKGVLHQQCAKHYPPSEIPEGVCCDCSAAIYETR